jgi:hypothetical protein
VKSQKYNELTLHWLNFLGDFPALLVISIAVLAAPINPRLLCARFLET